MRWKRVLGAVLVAIGGGWTLAGGALIAYQLSLIASHLKELAGPARGEYLGPLGMGLLLTAPGLLLLLVGLWSLRLMGVLGAKRSRRRRRR